MPDQTPSSETNNEAWDVAATAAGMAEANIIAGRLATEGIQARLSYESAGPVYAITIDGLGEVRILVPSSDLDRAREILSRAYEDSELPWEQAKED